MTITIHQARDLALRILGLYCGLQVFKTIPRLGQLAHLGSNPSYPGSPMLEMFGELVVTVAYLLAAYLLLLHTDYLIRRIWRADESGSEEQAPQPIASVDFWVRLIGVYYLIWSLANVASVIWYWLPGIRNQVESPPGYPGQLIHHGVMLALAIVCIRWPGAPFRLFRPEPMVDGEVTDS